MNLPESHRQEFEPDFSGKVAIVTGAARGMGAATARAFLTRGARVLLTDVVEPLSSMTEWGEAAAFMRHDVSNEGAWSQILDHAQQRFGRLNILVNNAGVLRLGSILETSSAQMEEVFRVNQLGVFYGMRAAAEAFKLSGGGAIVNMSSCVATRGFAGQFAYVMSKWAVRGMTKAAALELAEYKIRVNSVCPGPIDTPMMAVYSPEQKAALENMIPLKRLGQPEEVADAIAFLASDAARYISGAELSIDGGVFA